MFSISFFSSEEADDTTCPPPPPPPVGERRSPDLTGLRLEGPGRAPLWGSGARCSPLPLPAAAGICVPFYLQSHRHRTRPRLRSAVIFPSSSSPTCDDPRGSDRLIWTARDRRPCVQVSCSAASSPSAPGALPRRGPEHTPKYGTGAWPPSFCRPRTPGRGAAVAWRQSGLVQTARLGSLSDRSHFKPC